MIEYIILVMAIIFTHEFGHYLVARKENIYVGWGIVPNPHIKMERPYSNRWAYLSGLALSMFICPLWLWVFGLGQLMFFFIICFGAALLDIILVIFYGRLANKKGKMMFG